MEARELINTYMGFIRPVMDDLLDAYIERKHDLKKRWQESKLMPRKMKKRIRKELLISWSINESMVDTFKAYNLLRNFQ